MPSQRTTPQHTIDEAAAIAMAQLSIDLQADPRLCNTGTVAPASNTDLERLATTLELIGHLGIDPLCQANSVDSTPILLGRFHVRGELGRGGFGIVLRAYDPDLQREIALKVPLPERLLDGHSPDEFVQEARLAARLEHPGIVRVYEVARLEPIWYIASEYCDGPTLAKWLERQARPVRPQLAARLVAQIADAVHHAHTRGVLHLDLKPENVLIEEVADADNHIQTFVTDFGLAGLRDHLATTENPRIGGTVNYMAPEQMACDVSRIGVAADVFSIGAILHDMLSHQRCIARPATKEAERAESERITPAPRPPIATAPKDLDAICQRCLCHYPEQRYTSAGEVAEDLHRFLAGDLVCARRAPWTERSIRWCLRKPRTATLAGGLLLSIITGLVVAGILWQRAEQHLAETRALLYAANIKLSEGAWAEHNIRAVDALLRPFDGSAGDGPDLRGWEWYYFHRLCHEDLQSFVIGGDFECAALDKTAQKLILGTADGKILAIDTSNGSRLWSLDAFASNVTAIATSEDVQRFAAVDRNGECKVWEDLTKPQLVDQKSFPYGTVQAAAFDRQLKHISLSDPAFCVHYWDLKTGHEVKRFTGHTANITSLAMFANGEKVASGSEDGSIRIWNVTTGETDFVVERSAERILGITLSADEHYIAGGTHDGTVLAWEVGKPEPVFVQRCHADAVSVVRISADNKYLVSAGADRSIRVLNFPSGEYLRTAWGHAERVSALVFARETNRFLATSHDGAVKVWTVQQLDSTSPRPKLKDICNAVFADDGRSIAFRFSDGIVSVQSWPEMHELYRFQGPSGLDALAYDARQKLCAVSRKDATIEIWRERERVHTLEHHMLPARCLTFSTDAQLLAAAGRDGVISIWSPVKGTLLHSLKQEREAVCVAFDPSGPLLAASTGNHVELFNVHTGQLCADVNTLKHTIYGVSYSRDGTLLVAGDRSGAISVWDTCDAVPRATLTGHSDRVYASCFSPDNRRLVSCSRDETIRWWDLTTQRELCVMRGDWGVCENLALSPDGWTLLAIGKDKTLRMWDPRENTAKVFTAKQ